MNGTLDPSETFAIDWAKVKQYALLVREGVQMDPVDVFEIERKLLLVNGWHRWHAHEQADKGTIAANVHTGDMNAAMEFAAFANAKNALPLTKHDRREAVKLLLLAGGFERRSEREVTAELGIPKTTLHRWKRELMIELGIAVDAEPVPEFTPTKPHPLWDPTSGQFSAKGMPYHAFGQAVEQLLRHLERGEVDNQGTRAGVLAHGELFPDKAAARLRQLAAVLLKDADLIERPEVVHLDQGDDF